MQTLRNAQLVARFVLVWFALSIGIAIASPMVKPEGLQLVCSGAGSLKVVVTGDSGAEPDASHTLECPLCASISALPPMAHVLLTTEAPRKFGAPQGGVKPPFFVSAAPPPARGPPALF